MHVLEKRGCNPKIGIVFQLLQIFSFQFKYTIFKKFNQNFFNFMV